MSTAKKRMLISQPEPTSGRSPYHEIAKNYGYEVDFRQLIQTVNLEPIEFRAQRIDPLKFSAIVFISKTVIDCFFSLVKEMRITIPEDMKYFCTTEQVALYLQKYIVYRKRKVFFGQIGSLNELVSIMQKSSHAKEKYFIPIAEDGLDSLPSLLSTTNLHYTPAVTYRTITREMTEPLAENYQLILFFSPYGIKAMQELLPDFVQGDCIIGAFGKLACDAVENAGWRLDIPYTGATEKYRSMSGALEYYLENLSKPERKPTSKSKTSSKKKSADKSQ